MKHVIRGIGAAAALLAFASPAWAFGPFNNTEVCGGTSFYTCVTLTTTYDATTNTLTLTVDNSNTQGAPLFPIGVVGVTTATGGTPATGYGAFGAQNDLSGSGDLGFTYNGFKASNTPSALQGGQSGTFTFTFDSDFDDNIDGLALGMHFRSGPNDACTSSKLFVDANNGTSSPNGGVYADGCGPTTTVPEPITMSLLATGLAGMGGAGLIRRRNKKA